MGSVEAFRKSHAPPSDSQFGTLGFVRQEPKHRDTARLRCPKPVRSPPNCEGSGVVQICSPVTEGFRRQSVPGPLAGAWCDPRIASGPGKLSFQDWLETPSFPAFVGRKASQHRFPPGPHVRRTPSPQLARGLGSCQKRPKSLGFASLWMDGGLKPTTTTWSDLWPWWWWGGGPSGFD